MLSTGPTVMVRGFADIAWIVSGRGLDGRWRCVSKALNERGREILSSRSVGAGDITLVRPAPEYQPGGTVMFNGMPHRVLRDDGAAVSLEVPASRHRLRGGDHLRIAAGDTITVSKADLVLADLKE